MTEVFLINMKPYNGNKWECFRSTHRLDVATDIAREIQKAGHEVNVQSVLIDEDGRVSI